MKNYVLLLLTTNCVTVNFDPLIAELKNVTVKFEPLETMYHCSNAWNKKLTFLSLAHCWPCWTIVPGVHWWEPRSRDRSPLTPLARRANTCEAHQVTKPTKCSKRLKIMHYCVMYCVTWSECKCHDLLPSFFIADLLVSKNRSTTFWRPFCTILSSIWVCSQKKTRKSRRGHFGQQ